MIDKPADGTGPTTAQAFFQNVPTDAIQPGAGVEHSLPITLPNLRIIDCDTGESTLDVVRVPEGLSFQMAFREGTGLEIPGGFVSTIMSPADVDRLRRFIDGPIGEKEAALTHEKLSPAAVRLVVSYRNAIEKRNGADIDDRVDVNTYEMALFAYLMVLEERAAAVDPDQVVSVEAADATVDEMQRTIDNAYNERNRVVAALARLVIAAGGKAGLSKTEIEGWDPAWHNCVYIDGPNGQLSWHFHDREAPLFHSLPPYKKGWDGHTTEQKYERLDKANWLGVGSGDADVDTHRERHRFLHRAFEELAADYFSHNRTALPSNTSLRELMDWSYQQTLSPEPVE